MNKKLVSILAAAVMTTGAPAAALVPAIVAQGEPAVVVAEGETGFTDQYVKIKKSYPHPLRLSGSTGKSRRAQQATEFTDWSPQAGRVLEMSDPILSATMRETLRAAPLTDTL